MSRKGRYVFISLVVRVGDGRTTNLIIHMVKKTDECYHLQQLYDCFFFGILDQIFLDEYLRNIIL